MSRRHLGPIKTYKIVAKGAPGGSIGSPGAVPAMGLSAFVVAAWWFVTGVPASAVPPE